MKDLLAKSLHIGIIYILISNFIDFAWVKIISSNSIFLRNMNCLLASDLNEKISNKILILVLLKVTFSFFLAGSF